MRTRDRSQSVRGAHADEIIEPGLSKDDVVKIIEDTASADTPVTLTGLPSVGSPYFVASRVDPADNKVYVTVFFQNISAALKRFWITHKIVKANGTYGKPRRQAVPVTVQNKIDGQMQVELTHGWLPNRTVHLVLIEGKFVSAIDDDGGKTDQNPPAATYVDESFPGETTQAELASFSTGAAQMGNEVENECLNSKFRWSQATWDADVDGGGGANRLAKWRHGLATGFGGNPADDIVANSVSTARNYWVKTGHFVFGTTFLRAGTLFLYRGGAVLSVEDVCARLWKRPFDPGEPFHVQLSRLTARSLTSFDPAVNLIATLEDETAGIIATTTFVGINQTVGPFNWEPIRFPETTVSESYVQTPGAQQWVRLRLSASLSQSGVAIDKVSFSHMAGAYKPNPRDRQQTGDSDVVDTGGGGGRGTSGYGRTGGESPAGAGGQIIKGIVE